MNRFFRFAVFLVLAALSGCGLMMQNRWAVPVDSDPRGAVVTYDGSEVGVTPCTVMMRRQSKSVSVSLDGYQSQDITAGTRSNAWPIASLLMFGPLGLILDLAGDGGISVSESPLFVRLLPALETATPAAAQ